MPQLFVQISICAHFNHKCSLGSGRNRNTNRNRTRNSNSGSRKCNPIAPPTTPSCFVFGARFNSFRFRFASSKQFDLPSKWQVPVGCFGGRGVDWRSGGHSAGVHGGGSRFKRERVVFCVWLPPHPTPYYPTPPHRPQWAQPTYLLRGLQ